MTPLTGRNRQPECPLSSADLARLATPLDFIAEDHWREREICAALERLAATGQEDERNRTSAGDLSVSASSAPGYPDPEDIAQSLTFLTRELPLHLADEEEDLFPLMRRCCAPEDEIGRVIERLLLDHSHAAKDTPKVIAILEDLQSRPPTEQERQVLAQFASHARRHLILENAVVLPIARLRLRSCDHESLRLCMMQRRGIPLPEVDPGTE